MSIVNFSHILYIFVIVDSPEWHFSFYLLIFVIFEFFSYYYIFNTHWNKNKRYKFVLVFKAYYFKKHNTIPLLRL